MTLNLIIHTMILGIMILPGCAMQKSGDHKRTGVEPFVHERYIGGDLYRSGVHIHHHPEWVPPTKCDQINRQ